MDLGLTQRATLMVILMLAAFFVLINLLLLDVLNINILFCLDIALWTGMHVWISSLIEKRKQKAKATK
jgi:hypothetical protein